MKMRKAIRGAVYLVLALVLLISVSFSVYAASASDTITGLTANDSGLAVSWKASNNFLASNVNNSKATNSGADGITITAAAYDGFLSDYDTTVKVTMTNQNSDKKAMHLEFASSQTPSVGSGVETVSSTSPYHYVLDYGESVSVSYTNSSTKAASISITSIKFYSDDDVSITFTPITDGSGSYSVNNITVAAETVVAYGDVSTIGVVPSDGYAFAGWMTSDGVFLDKDNTTNFLSVKPDDDIKICAYFVPDDACKFQVGTQYYFYWEDACTAAVSGGNNIVLAKDGTLPNRVVRNKIGSHVVNEGTTDAPDITYTLPNGVKFLIPYGAGDTGYFGDTDTRDAENTQTKASTAYRVLTIDNGAVLVVNGTMSVNSLQGAPGAGTTGFVTGQYGQVKLNGTDAKITVNGTLVAFGYITGTGIVHAQTGAVVHEYFQINDWRGGNATSSWMSGNYTAFAVSEYFIQNIESRYRVDSGAYSYAHAAITATIVSKVSTNEARAEFIGPSGLFRMGAGSYLIREYVAAEDVVTYDIYGSVTTASIDLSIASYTLKTSEYIMGLTHGMRITIKGEDEEGNVLASYADVTEDFRLLPGVEFFIEENATLEIDSSANLFLYDLADWSDSYIYINTDATTVKTVCFTPSTKGTRAELKSALLQVDGTLIGYNNIYSTSSSENSADKVITGTGTFKNNASADGYTKVEIIEMSGNSSEASVTTVNVIGNLSGVGTMQSFSTGTYYGLGSDKENYWYQYIVNVAKNGEESVADMITVTSGMQTAGTSVTHEDKKDITDIIGYVAKGGTFTFTAPNCVTAITASNNATVTAGTAAEKTTAYTLTNVTADTTLSFTIEHSYDSGKITKDPTADAAGEMTYTCETCGGISTEKVLFQQSTQLGLKEPWFMKSNLYIKVGENYMTQEQLNALVDYGVYFVRASELGITDTSVMPEVQTIIDHAETVHYSKSSKQYPAVIEKGEAGYMITASYVKGIYTYELADPVYVLYYIEDTAGVHYAEVKLRNLYEIADAAQTNKKFSKTEQAVYTCMVTMYDTVTAHRDTFDSIPEMSVHKAPAVTKVNFGTYQENCVVAHSVNVVLIEPWGLRLNGYVNETKGIQDCGVVVFYDKNGDYEEAPTVAQLIANEGAYVFSTSNGNATATVIGEDTKITADYTKDVYTYQLDDKAYAVFFVKIDGVYHFGEVKPRTVLEQIEKAQASDVATETEKAVYAAMLDMYKKVTAHRATFDLN